MLRNNLKQFCKTINPSCTITSSNIVLRDNHNNLIAEHCVAQVLNDTFCAAFTVEPNNELPHAFHVNHPIKLEIRFDANGIAKIIDSLKLISSTGIDEFNVKLPKNTKTAPSFLLLHIFQRSLTFAVVPQDSKVGKVIRILKKGTKIFFVKCTYKCIYVFKCT